MKQKIDLRPAVESDLVLLEDIRQAAFRPVFDSFRRILGDRIYALAQAPEDERQDRLLRDLLSAESDWRIYVAQMTNRVVGFVSFRLDAESRVGEIGLNAVHPRHAGQGIGTEMYQFAVAEMKRGGMLVATVATGGDPAHGPARRAYEKSGFDVRIPSVWMCQKL